MELGVCAPLLTILDTPRWPNCLRDCAAGLLQSLSERWDNVQAMGGLRCCLPCTPYPFTPFPSPFPSLCLSSRPAQPPFPSPSPFKQAGSTALSLPFAFQAGRLNHLFPPLCLSSRPAQLSFPTPLPFLVLSCTRLALHFSLPLKVLCYVLCVGGCIYDSAMPRCHERHRGDCNWHGALSCGHLTHAFN